MRFTKYHGLGNDFLLIDRRSKGHSLTEERVRQLCDRREGIGADGILVIEEDTQTSNLRMRVFNADGSRPEMCGNGLRCFVKHCVDILGFEGNPLTVHTDAGIKACAWERDGDEVSTIIVEMGAPEFDPEKIPLSKECQSHQVDLKVSRQEYKVHCVSMGNPHAVLFGSWTQKEMDKIGPHIQSNSAFPQGVNVGFATVEDAHSLSLTVYERGAGFTQACGTGACAAVTAGVSLGTFPFDEEIEVRLPGGSLRIRVAPDFQQIWMSGPATQIMDGQVQLRTFED